MREMVLLPREAKENSREFAYRVLRENIITLTLPPGEVLNEQVLAEQLSISRTPVREAIFTLRKENMVVVRPQTASTVSLIDDNLLRQGIMMQVTVEMEILSMLCGNMDETLIQRLRDNLRRQREILQTDGSERQYLTLDDEFHRYLYLAARKDRLYRAAKTLASQLDRVRYLLVLEGRIGSLSGYGEHKEIFTRLVAGVRGGLASLYLPHRTGVEPNILYIAGKYPEFFKTAVTHDDRITRMTKIIEAKWASGGSGTWR